MSPLYSAVFPIPKPYAAKICPNVAENWLQDFHPILPASDIKMSIEQDSSLTSKYGRKYVGVFQFLSKRVTNMSQAVSWRSIPKLDLKN